MAKGAIATEFRRNEKVRALDDLPGVPPGTEGRVELVAGFAWTRYRVAFENGVDIGSIDGSHLSRSREYEAALRQREEDAAAAAVEEADEDEGEQAAAAASGGDEKIVNGVTVPSHLLERSSKARARVAA